MPSWQALVFSLGVRLLMHRRNWGDEQRLVRRARRVVGASRPQQWLRTRGVRIEPVNEGGVRGEWITPREARGER